MDDFSASSRIDHRDEVFIDPALQVLPEAAALFDLRLELMCANSRFLSLCASPHTGCALAELLPPACDAPPAPNDGASLSYLARDSGGRPVEVRLARNGQAIGALARQVTVSAADAPLSAAMEALGQQSHQLDSLLAMSKEVALAASEDELVAAIARCTRALFPGRHFCVRIVDPRTFGLTSLYAEGRLLEGTRSQLALRRAAVEKAQLDLRGVPSGVLTLTEDEPLVFAGAVRGVVIPLAAAGQLFGILNLEYPQGLVANLERDERLFIQLANQAAIGVRNAKLIEELTFVRRYLEELIENANALILVVNRRKEVIVFNQALVELSGISRSDVIGKPVSDLIAERDQARMDEVLEASLGGERVSHCDLLLKSSSGAEVRTSFSSSTVRTATGEVEGVIAIGQDLSKQRELERRVVQAEKMASLGQLAAGVVHEINNPLTAITMYADSLLQSCRVPGDLEKLRRIRESTDRILRFARDLTSYARPSVERPEDVDLHELIEQAARYCEHAVKQSNATLVRAWGQNVPRVHGVRANLVQVFVNLVTNACHSLPKEGGQIVLVTRERESGAEVEVRDTGAGIDAQQLQKIFEPFFTTKPEGHGTGLGLTIVQGIIEKHGGTIRVVSTKGVGTTFTLWLPAKGRVQPILRESAPVGAIAPP
jgi:PAS domain S-box-containing protein